MSAPLAFLDTSVFLTALGEHPNTSACRALLRRAANGHLSIHTAAECLLAGFDAVVTPHDRFVEVPGLRRVHPRDVAA